jgi:hypothetical protein
MEAQNQRQPMNHTVVWYPKNIVIGLLLLAGLAMALQLAADVQRGIVVGALGVAAYVIVDVLFSVNPAAWQRRR